MNYGFLIDNGACIGCHACSTACKSENQVPLGVNRTWVKYVESGRFPDVRRAFQVTRCNHCANPPCVQICPTGAMYRRDDGIVEFDGDACIGCKGCIQACPYDAIYLDPDTHTAAKCHFCAHRVDVGLEPACVVVCPEHAILAGDLDDPESEISRRLARSDVTVRKPEQGTAPKLFYVQGNEASLTPGAARSADQYMFADVVDDHAPQQPLGVGGRMAEHMVAYDTQHAVHWHWPIPAYLVTKYLSAGVFLFLALLALVPALPFSGRAMVWGGGWALALYGLTLALLVYDLDRPDRFFYLLLRTQWRSWIARAAWILTAFGVVAGGWWAIEVAARIGWFDLTGLRPWLAAFTVPCALMAAVYTGFLFAQAKGRDLWQSSHLPLLMTAHTVVFGCLPIVSLSALFPLPQIVVALAMLGSLLGLAASLLLTVVGDLVVPHASEGARRANHEMVRGRYSHTWWLGGIVLGHLVPLAMLMGLGPVAAPAALSSAAIGLFLYGYGLVIAPQEIPNS